MSWLCARLCSFFVRFSRRRRFGGNEFMDFGSGDGGDGFRSLGWPDDWDATFAPDEFGESWGDVVESDCGEFDRGIVVFSVAA